MSALCHFTSVTLHGFSIQTGTSRSSFPIMQSRAETASYKKTTCPLHIIFQQHDRNTFYLCLYTVPLASIVRY